MSKWAIASQSRLNYGLFIVTIAPPGVKKSDVTLFRGAPVEILSYSSADPFGDATAQLRFSTITPFDDLGEGDLYWLKDFADVDIYVAQPGNTGFLGGSPVRKIWEGFIASYEFSATEEDTALTIQCQGALYQIDKYVEGPSFPQRPVPYENQIRDAFDPHRRSHLRTQPLKTVFPSWWTKVQPSGTPNIYTPQGVKPGDQITGFSSRVTGSWDRSLTSYIQNMLQVMLVDETGDQWTVRKDANRQPVLYVREVPAVPKYSVWVGQPGLTLSLTRDLTQYANVIYGQGADPSGVEFKRQKIAFDGSRTDYDPLAYSPAAYPDVGNNKFFDPAIMRAETYIKYDNGFDERQAIASAKQNLRRNSDPGLSGTITLSVDPSGGSRYEMKAGEQIILLGLLGTGSAGRVFHIAEVTVSPDSGTTECKVDTKFRDLLTLEEVLVRQRDPLTPAKMLQINKRSVLIEDVTAPWDYTGGSGFIPFRATGLYANMAPTTQFPYIEQTTKYPPFKNMGAYVQVVANAGSKDQPNRAGRWSFRPVVLSAKGTIRRTEVCCYDANGNRLAIPFHFALYYVNVTADNMPRDANGPSPFIDNAFQDIDVNGNPIPAGVLTRKQDSLIIGWGNGEQPAGYSPGLKTAGTPCTGMLVDEQEWHYDLTNNPDYKAYVSAGKRPPTSSVTVYAALYAEYHDFVYFTGRLYHRDAGT